jgi:EpsI family protein
VTSVLIYRQTEPVVVVKPLTLSQAFANIDGWHNDGLFDLETRIIESLDIDDYINTRFSKDDVTVSLYIGYYLTLKKVGASHSPLVCYPGQGWYLSDGEKESLIIGEEKINLVRMIASIGSRKELLVYWFQAYDKNSTGTFLQKLNTLWSKFQNGREDNAFVRITIPISDSNADVAYKEVKEFIKLFYPRFLKYVKENQI